MNCHYSVLPVKLLELLNRLAVLPVLGLVFVYRKAPLEFYLLWRMQLFWKGRQTIPCKSQYTLLNRGIITQLPLCGRSGYKKLMHNIHVMQGAPQKGKEHLLSFIQT